MLSVIRRESRAVGDLDHFVLEKEPAGHRTEIDDPRVRGSRFYTISPEARLNFAWGIAHYIVFLAATTGLVDANRCATASARLDRYTSLEEMLAEI